jgi:hypothetical protein
MPEERKTHQTGMIVGAAVIGVLLAGGGFAAGMQYQKSHSGTAASVQRGFGAGGGGGFAGRRRSGAAGAVTAISDSSITLDDARSGTSKTFTVNGSTEVLNQGASATLGDIKTGDQVFVITSSTDSSVATRIMLGGFGGGAPASQPNTSLQ